MTKSWVPEHISYSISPAAQQVFAVLICPGRGVPTLAGYPPPPGVDRQMPVKTVDLSSPILQMRAVIM